MSVKGEKYSSRKQMLRHEKTESKKDRMKEYGPKGMAYGKAEYGKRKPCC